ncbi:BQ5605_C029g10705 [Microbotryum silenes-dioicae]|uniref:BQ5605_C029g10705 protein n=1 Tax=Microbotryum silenes-dioicae TaxID=796604 RepID=A0A2X0N5B8_9BASI|nr:BQ5605_C029g10705 [Microbotryum silenes-dioicae]
MLADMFTKALPRPALEQHRVAIGMGIFHWEDGVTGGAGGRRGSACSHLDPENILDLPNYSRCYAKVREGLFTGRMYAKEYPTQLPVTVDEHPGQLAQGFPTLGSGHPG